MRADAVAVTSVAAGGRAARDAAARPRGVGGGCTVEVSGGDNELQWSIALAQSQQLRAKSAEADKVSVLACSSRARMAGHKRNVP